MRRQLTSGRGVVIRYAFRSIPTSPDATARQFLPVPPPAFRRQQASTSSARVSKSSLRRLSSYPWPTPVHSGLLSHLTGPCCESRESVLRGSNELNGRSHRDAERRLANRRSSYASCTCVHKTLTRSAPLWFATAISESRRAVDSTGPSGGTVSDPIA